MKVLVATSRGQGLRDNDFTFCADGELLRFGFECDGEQVDGSCGCRRSLAGSESSKATTTFTVVDRPDLDVESYAWTLGAALVKDGWTGELAATEDEVLEEAAELADLAAGFDVGDLLERRGDEIQKRNL